MDRKATPRVQDEDGLSGEVPPSEPSTVRYKDADEGADSSAPTAHPSPTFFDAVDCEKVVALLPAKVPEGLDTTSSESRLPVPVVEESRTQLTERAGRTIRCPTSAPVRVRPIDVREAVAADLAGDVRSELEEGRGEKPFIELHDPDWEG
jgi:hypothetical protein